MHCPPPTRGASRHPLALWTDDAMHIPTVNARTLSGLSVTIPDDFTGERNALLIAFDKSHLILFPAWRAALREALAADQTLGFYAVALIGEVSTWQARATAFTLRLEIGDDEAREHIAMVADAPQSWARALRIKTMDLPLLAICSPDGEVHALAEGPPRAVTAQSAARALLM